jgi:hypothetical protein
MYDKLLEFLKPALYCIPEAKLFLCAKSLERVLPSLQVQESKSIPLRYMFDRNFTKNYFKSIILTSFNELQGSQSWWAS